MKRHVLAAALLGAAYAAVLTAGAAAAGIGSHSFRLSVASAEDHPVSLGLKHMAACLKNETGGKMKIRTFFNGELGDDAEATQSVRSGSIDMVVAGAAAIGGIEPAMTTFELPFLFKSEQEVDAVVTGPFFDHVAAKMPAHGLVLLSIWENGFRNASNSKHPIARVEDFQGLNFRVMQNPIFLATFRRLGTNPVPMPFSEVFTGLETGAVDGQENPLPLFKAGRFYEVQKYLTLTRHVYSPTPLLINKDRWDALNPDEQAALQACADEARAFSIKRSRDSGAEALDFVRQHGVEVTELSADETAKLRALVAPVYETAIPMVGQDNYDRLMAELNKLRAH